MTFSDLNLEQKSDGKELWSASQFVEPIRGGEEWCTWEHAEDMLVVAAKAVMRGAAGVPATCYSVSRDEDKMTLSLSLME